jgi:hypothetical protein
MDKAAKTKGEGGSFFFGENEVGAKEKKWKHVK